jgi:hypothetical protein
MTAQASENLRYDGEHHAMCTTPLEDFFAAGEARPDFMFQSTALWRGYVGSWEIIDDHLYLTGLSGKLKSGQDVSIASMFEGFSGSVFAYWYSGDIRLPKGELLEYVHGGFESIYERDLLLNVERGVLKSVVVKRKEPSAD